MTEINQRWVWLVSRGRFGFMPSVSALIDQPSN
jgi:hypothetical protein